MKRNGNAERQRRENRGAEGGGRGAAGAEVEREVECGEGVSPPHPGGAGEGAVPPLKKFFFDFGSQYGEFLCILDGIFLQFSYLFYTQNRSSTAIGI